MELLAEHDLPGTKQPVSVVEVSAAGCLSRQNAQDLGPAQPVFQLPVSLLIVRLGGISSPVEFQVQLPVPHRQIASQRILF